MHRFSTAVPQSSALTALCFLGLLGVLHEYACGALRRMPCHRGACGTSSRKPMHSPGLAEFLRSSARATIFQSRPSPSRSAGKVPRYDSQPHQKEANRPDRRCDLQRRGPRRKPAVIGYAGERWWALPHPSVPPSGCELPLQLVDERRRPIWRPAC